MQCHCFQSFWRRYLPFFCFLSPSRRSSWWNKIESMWVIYFRQCRNHLIIKISFSQKAKQSLCFYKNIRVTDKDVDHTLEVEIDKLKSALGDSENVNSRGNWTAESISIARNAMVMGFVLVSLYIYSGVTPMTFYVATIFQETGSSLSPNMSAIVIGTIQLIGTCVATELVERVGRKVNQSNRKSNPADSLTLCTLFQILLVVSCFGTAASLIVMGVYMMLKTWGIPLETVNWIPLASYSAATFISAIGIQSLTLTVVYEIAPEKIKETYMSFCMTLLWILNFVSTKYLPMLLDVLEFHGSMYLFSGVCILSAIYILLYMPETKGKTYEQIMNALASKNARQNNWRRLPPPSQQYQTYECTEIVEMIYDLLQKIYENEINVVKCPCIVASCAVMTCKV